jgi:hypothetical protein
MPKFVDDNMGISRNVLTAILLVLITLVTAVASVGLTSEVIQAKTATSTTTESASTITESTTVSNTITLAQSSSSGVSSTPAITHTVTEMSSITTLVSSIETDTTTVSDTQTVTNTQISLVTSASQTTITQITPVTVITTATSTITIFSTMPFICENTNVQTNVASPGNSAFYGCLPTNNNWWVLNMSSANGFPLYWKYIIFSTASSYSGSPIEVLTNNQSASSETCHNAFNPCSGSFRGNYININVTTAQYAPVNVTVELSY